MIQTSCRLLKRNVSSFQYFQSKIYSSRVMNILKQEKPIFVKTTNYNPNEDINAYGIMEILKRKNPVNFTMHPLKSEHHEAAVDIIKKYYLPEHVLVRSRNVDLSQDQAITEYLKTLLKQGKSLYAKSEDGKIAGVCINFAARALDPANLRHYAFYRQDPNTKDFLYLTARLQETPNFWSIFKQAKIFEVKMLTVIPEFRRQGLAGMLTERSIHHAEDQGYKIMRMDCINDYDYKIAERCMMRCCLRFPLHKLRSATAPFIKRTSTYNTDVAVYVHATQTDAPYVQFRRADVDSIID